MLRHLKRIAAVAIMALPIFSAIAPVLAQDEIVFPEPTGDYAVGVTRYPFVG